MVGYEIDIKNSSPALIKAAYGNVHDWWISAPTIIDKKAQIEVYNKYSNQCFHYIIICLQVKGKGSASGTFTVTVSGQKLQVDFSYELAGKPTLTPKQLTQGPYVIQILTSPYADETTAYASIQVVDPR